MPRLPPARRPQTRARRPKRPRLTWRRSLYGALAVAAAGALFGLAFAGSPATLAAGVRIAGVDVGGLSTSRARAFLERRSRAMADVPVVFTAAGRTWRLRPGPMGVSVDWGAAVASAARQGGGPGPLRGFRRIEMRVFGADVAPPVRVYEAALDYELDRFAKAIRRPRREPALRLRGLTPVVVPGRPGRALDREAAAELIVHALAGLTREPVALPVRVDRPRLTADDLAAAKSQAETALSAPVRLTLGATHWRIPRWRLATLLSLPRDGRRKLRIGGPGADDWFARLAKTIDRPARDADFVVTTTGVSVVPARSGVSLDVAATARALLAGALSPTRRVAQVTVVRSAPSRSTAEARRMGIAGLVASYETLYGGDPNRIHNVQLVAHLIDKHLIAPGQEFSFNRTTGERTAAKGFREAPVIINGELQTGLGGGVCQVSTTTFNAAYEAGLPITARTNHALYISHYPQGRDATVDYPSVDLRFVNDTGHWLLLRTFVGPSSLVVSLYGTPMHRRVVTDTAPLKTVAAPPVERVRDPTLAAGKTVVEDSGSPARSTSVRRRVYDASGKLIADDTWSSSYRAEPDVVRVGTKKKPKPKKPKPATTTTTTTTTTTATTTQPKKKSQPRP
ncbi:MAG TPA: VanW family protein [Gaiellaceae bacterium]|nr:VanW family protein [Gaiellaceae bacterium]